MLLLTFTSGHSFQIDDPHLAYKLAQEGNMVSVRIYFKEPRTNNAKVSRHHQLCEGQNGEKRSLRSQKTRIKATHEYNYY